MALVKVHFDALYYIPQLTKACNQIAICLDPNGIGGQVANGVPMVFATVQNSGRPLGSGGRPFSPPWENPRCEEHYEYILEYDDAQMNSPQDIITCEDIQDIVSACILQTFIELHP